MIDAVSKSKCENMMRLDLIHLDRFEMYSKLLAVGCPCLQALMSHTPHTKPRPPSNTM